MLIGARKGRVYRMGDRVKVKVTRVDRHKREIDFDIVDVEIREDRGIVVAEDERREKRRRFLEYAAEARKVRPAKRGPSAAGEKAKGRGRPRKRRRSASSGKPQSPRRKTGGRSGGKHKPAGQAGPKKPSASGRRRKPRRGPRGGPKRSRKSGV
jgi:ribonuclease R